MPNIEIPEPVIKAVTQYGWTDEDKYTIEVQIGGVTVMTRVFHGEYAYPEPDNYAGNVEEAERKALTEFGKKIRALIGEEKD